MTDTSELDKFNGVLRKIMSVPREEMQKREKEWKRKQALKKAHTSNENRLDARRPAGGGLRAMRLSAGVLSRKRA